MKLYHVISEPELDILHLFPDRSLNILLSAWRIDQDARFRKAAPLIRRKAADLFIDSGMLAALKSKCLRWAETTERVVELALEFDANRVAALDIPMEPQFLAGIGWSGKRALQKTWENMADFAAMRLPLHKVYVVQGWTLDQYEQSVEQYAALEHEEDSWVALGTCCMRNRKVGKYPAELHDLVAAVRTRLPDKTRHTHVFGIAQPQWLTWLEQLGVASCDSATAAMWGVYGKMMGWDGKANSVKRPCRSAAQKALAAWNIAMMEELLARETDTEAVAQR